MNKMNYEMLQERINECLVEMDNLEPGTESYDKVLKNYRDLQSIKNETDIVAKDVMEQEWKKEKDISDSKHEKKMDVIRVLADVGKAIAGAGLLVGYGIFTGYLEVNKHEIRTTSASRLLDKIIPTPKL